jgi:hypothetical protein
VNTVNDRNVRAVGANRPLVWTAATCITVSLLAMIVISVAGPSITEPAMAHAPGFAPPWWVSIALPRPEVLFIMWGVAVVGGIGVGAGLLAVTRGARFRVRPLLAASFIAIAALTVLPAAGSSDAQSYAIDGNMVVLRHSPYVWTPAQMVVIGDQLAVNGPPTWQRQLSDYGPVATAEELVSAELGGSSMAQITFWLKLWVALSFGAVVLLLDRLLRDDPEMRLRAHLLWSVNPILLWEIVASGHIDGFAVAFGLGGLALLRFTKSGMPPTLIRCAAAGALLGVAAATKSPFALFLLGAVWGMRRSPARVASVVGGWLWLVLTAYAIAGIPAVHVLFQRSHEATWDNPFAALYRPFGLAGAIGDNDVPGFLFSVAIVVFIAVAVLVLFRLPDRVPGLPGVTPSLALSLAWIFCWPFQRPWYDVMIIALLVLYPATKLDALVLFRLTFGAISAMQAIHIPQWQWYEKVVLVEGDYVSSAVRLLCLFALIWLCATGRWTSRPGNEPTNVSQPMLQPLT